MYDELIKRLKNNRYPNGLKSQAADAIEQMFGGEEVYFQSTIDRAPTIIPAEEGE